MDETAVTERPFLVIERFFPVAPEKVWRAWTDPQAIRGWFGPGGGDRVSVAELDVRAGGRYRIVFGGAQGDAHEVRGIYREVEIGRRLVFTWVWPRTTPDRESLVSIELRRAGNGTEMVFRHAQFHDEPARDGHRQGWSGSFEKLERLLQLGQ